MHLNKMKTFEAKARRESEMKFYNVVKVGLSEPEWGGVAPPPTALERRPPGAPIPAHSTAHAGGRAAGARPRTLHPPTCDLETWQGPPESESRVLVDICPLGAHSPGGLSSVAPHGATSGSAGTGPSLPLPPSPGLCPPCPGCVLPRLPPPSRWTRSQGLGSSPSSVSSSWGVFQPFLASVSLPFQARVAGPAGTGAAVPHHLRARGRPPGAPPWELGMWKPAVLVGSLERSLEQEQQGSYEDETVCSGGGVRKARWAGKS